MRDVLAYTFFALKDYKKSFSIVFLLTIFSYLERLPFISLILFIFEKILLFSIGSLIIYLLSKSKNYEHFYKNIKLQPISTLFFHFLPTAMGAVFGLMILMFSITGLLYFVLSLFTVPFVFDMNIIFTYLDSSIFLSLMLLFYSFYILLVIYVLFGKVSLSLNSHNFKGAFLAIISSLVDYKYFLRTNIKYFSLFIFYFFVAVFYYIISTFIFNWIIYKDLFVSPFNIMDIFLIFFISFFTLFNIYLFFISSYFANRETVK